MTIQRLLGIRSNLLSLTRFLLPVVVAGSLACRSTTVGRVDGGWSEATRVVLPPQVVSDNVAAFRSCEESGSSVAAATSWLVPAASVAEAEAAAWRALVSDSLGQGMDFSGFRRQIAGVERDGRRFVHVIGIGSVYFADTTSSGVPAAVRREWRSVPMFISHPGRNQFEAIYDVSAGRVCLLRFGNRA